jgi:PQQ-dependent catabolism-associated CXXCW motif protein
MRGRGRLLDYLPWAAALLVVAAPVASVASAADREQRYFDPATGFRIHRYRAPTPESAPGATRIASDEIAALVNGARAILVDVMPAEGAGLDRRTGEWRLSKPRAHIPGSVWLPDVGKGVLSAEMDAYFRASLERLTGGDRTRPLIFYCLADCWMGWNAVKRAAGYGYSRLYWFPEGTDGWRDWEGDLVPATPEPNPASTR